MYLRPQVQENTSVFFPGTPERAVVELYLKLKVRVLYFVSLTHGLKVILTPVPRTSTVWGKSHCDPHPKHFCPGKITIRSTLEVKGAPKT